MALLEYVLTRLFLLTAMSNAVFAILEVALSVIRRVARASLPVGLVVRVSCLTYFNVYQFSAKRDKGRTTD